MKIEESVIRQIIREFIALDESIYSGLGVSTSATTMSADERTKAQRAAALASQQAATAAKKGLTPTVAAVRDDINKMDSDSLRKSIEDFKIEKVKEDPKADEKAVAATLKLAADRKIPGAALNQIVQRNKSLSATLSATKGGADLEKAAEKDLESKGKNPAKDPSLAWQTIGNIASRQDLA